MQGSHPDQEGLHLVHGATATKGDDHFARDPTKPPVGPEIFARHVSTEDMVRLKAFGQTYFIHQSILQRSPFFQAKLARWSDEELQIPKVVTPDAFWILLKHLYTGDPVTTKDTALLLQIFYLAKIWLMEDVEETITRNLMCTAERKDRTMIEDFAHNFDVPELWTKVDEFQEQEEDSEARGEMYIGVGLAILIALLAYSLTRMPFIVQNLPRNL
eukprot:gnl/MRDRNA2_/MRDRNA2_43271_c0_seq1.p1 gnl/MRDRNA2_/MRDRNA2_43271_c0~~gnl/MRDRNA2_/MRDRNA2_43271_c0_seq1.p1  ORF type:complete len:215 (+),score=38.24 gnl/MRDRNA2_/MRDRNA2_43271_c0_seq1:143-787(+)